VSWRTLAWWELRARLSPEVLAGGLSIVVLAAIAGVLWLGPPATTGPAGGGSGADPTSSPAASATPAPTATADTTSGRAILVLNERILEIATEAEAARLAEPFSSADAAAVLRRLNATLTSARELVGFLEREPRTAAVGTELQSLYLGLKTLADDALGSSLSNAAAYRSALAEIPSRTSRLAALDEELEKLLD